MCASRKYLRMHVYVRAHIVIIVISTITIITITTTITTIISITTITTITFTAIIIIIATFICAEAAYKRTQRGLTMFGQGQTQAERFII